MDQRLLNYRQVWEQKPVLQAVYHDYYRQILDACNNNGLTLEIGGGSGNIKDYIPDLISIDILQAQWLDIVADAQKLPIASDTFQNIILFDVLHHIESPKLFFNEASRILKSGGKIIILEPGITPLSWFFYNFFHQEPVVLNTNPITDETISSDRDPYDSNQAIPTLLFNKYSMEFNKTYPDFKVIKKEWLSLYAYPLSGGFKKWSLLKAWMVAPILKLEKLLMPVIGSLSAFRLFIVIEKNQH